MLSTSPIPEEVGEAAGRRRVCRYAWWTIRAIDAQNRRSRGAAPRRQSGGRTRSAVARCAQAFAGSTMFGSRTKKSLPTPTSDCTQTWPP